MPTQHADLIKDAKKAINYRKSPSLLKECWDHKTIEQFADHITDGEHTNENPALPDCLALYNVPFTMEEYDHDGKYVTYQNIKLGITIEIEHENRYNDMRELHQIKMYHTSGYRNDITYIQ